MCMYVYVYTYIFQNITCGRLGYLSYREIQSSLPEPTRSWSATIVGELAFHLGFAENQVVLVIYFDPIEKYL